MQKILVVGAGKIGTLIALLLAESGIYRVYLVDKKNNLVNSSQNGIVLNSVTLDVNDSNALVALIQKEQIKSLMCCLPYFHNIKLATLAKEYDLNYFDLTEDIHVSEAIMALAKGASRAFVPHCGLAPGFINIITASMIRHFDHIEEVLLCAGALPACSHNALKYALNWSTEGLINEYINPCLALIEGKKTWVRSLEGYEKINIDGLEYEIFNTSGGGGTLPISFEKKIKTLHYKTIRYPGHCEKMKFLLSDLLLREKRDILKNIMEEVIPATREDVVILYVAVKGMIQGKLQEETYVKKLYPQIFLGESRSAIQLATAHAACAVVDTVLHHQEAYQGMIFQESFALQTILSNKFGQYYS